MDPEVLPRTAGGFRLLRQLGRGGMGVVYEAEVLSSGRHVALKFPTVHHSVPEEAYKRFNREAELAASISHRNCVFVYGAHHIEDRPAISMELMSGETLKDRLSPGNPIPIETAIAWTLDIIDGLEAARRAGVIHRDVKPSNCFFTPDGTVKIGDFGLSKTLVVEKDHLTQTGQFLGTPSYSSPEQIRGDRLDFRSDLYSVGATLFALLSGRPPFVAHDMGRLLAMVLEQQPPSLQSLRPDIPPELERVVLKAMDKRPDRRFGSYHSFRAALVRFAEGQFSPASARERFGAFLIDEVAILMTIPVIKDLTRDATPDTGPLVGALGVPLWMVMIGVLCGYFVILDVWGGGTIGRRLLRLQVVSESSLQPRVWTWRLTRQLLFLAWIVIGGLFTFLLARYPYVCVLVPACWAAALFPALPLRTFTILRHLHSSTDRRDLYRGIARSALGLGALIGLAVVTYLATYRVVPAVVIAYTFGAWILSRCLPDWSDLRGLHDRLSRSRVVRTTPDSQSIPATSQEDDSWHESGEEGLKFPIPYLVGASRGDTSQGRLFEGRDSRLNRPIWIHVHPEPASGSAPNLQDQPTRLRQIESIASGGMTYAIYESPGGTSLMERCAKNRATWPDALRCLTDLSDDLHASPRNVALDQLWIDRLGFLRVLDFSLGSGQVQAVPPMHALAAMCKVLTGQSGSAAGMPRDLPAHAEALWRRIVEQASSPDSELDQIRTALRACSIRTTSLTRRMRLVSLALPGLWVCLVGALSVQFADHDSFENFVGGIAALVWTAAFLCGLASVVMALSVRTGAGFRIAGIDIRTRAGKRASRLRCAWRSLVTWSPVLFPLVPLLPDQASGMRVVAGVTMLFLLGAGTVASAFFPTRGLQDLIAGTRLVAR